MKKFIILFTKSEVFGKVIWPVFNGKNEGYHTVTCYLEDKIQPDEINQIIVAEESDPALFDIVTKKMVHVSCGEQM